MTRDRNAVQTAIAKALYLYDRVLIQGLDPRSFEDLSRSDQSPYLALAEDAIGQLTNLRVARRG
jgi:hypothetical protein